jgi:hypothetical protein
MLIRGTMPSLPADQVDAILEVLTPEQLTALTCMLKKVKELGYGRVTLAIQRGVINQIQVMQSYDFRSDSIDQTIQE